MQEEVETKLLDKQFKKGISAENFKRTGGGGGSAQSCLGQGTKGWPLRTHPQKCIFKEMVVELRERG